MRWVVVFERECPTELSRPLRTTESDKGKGREEFQLILLQLLFSSSALFFSSYLLFFSAVLFHGAQDFPKIRYSSLLEELCSSLWVSTLHFLCRFFRFQHGPFAVPRQTLQPPAPALGLARENFQPSIADSLAS